MTELEFAERDLTIRVQGADKFWALKSELKIPLDHIVDVTYDPEIAKAWYHGLKMPGSQIPGVLTAGTFYKAGEKVFWDVHHADKTIVIHLKDESYHKLVIEVNDPQYEIARIEAKIK